ncbi:MAG: WYL domain-containing protein [Gemmatimonadaceae bacterium]|nr:WYL domain-containing protein [Gemmatimonadaceae bacterium]
MPPTDKLRRWIDLLAALLSKQTPLTFTELARRVPAYLADGSVLAGKPSDTLKRMFERDKDELRAQGVPIESVGELGSEQSAYTLKVRDFYLPYLGVVTAHGVQRPDKLDRFGYGSIECLAFEPDELLVIADSVARVLQVGDPMLAGEARSARRKLAFDLPMGATDAPTTGMLVEPVPQADAQLLSTLGDALFARKRVTFNYHSMAADRVATRAVEPYGLFFVSGYWYLAARDADKNAMRNFRVNRMTEAKITNKEKASPDFDIPASFSLRAHAKSRQAWEIGDMDALEAVVEFRGQSGAVLAARALGKPDTDNATVRRFDIRQRDSFARWLMSFAGDAVPVAPDSLVQEYRQLVLATRARYVTHA